MAKKDKITGRLTIGMLASQANTSVPTIRYYEEIGLLPRARRSANGHRYYLDTDSTRLTFIKRCRDFGFSIEQVRELLTLFEDGSRACVEAREMAALHRNTVRRKINELRALETTLTVFVESCNEASCSGGITGNCTIIQELSGVEDDLPETTLSMRSSQQAELISPSKTIFTEPKMP